uniref:Uncharacterized protein n=1 Tax=Arundo donax TaxID=35708 RepID=A0A0A9EKJ2_ARUDO
MYHFAHSSLEMFPLQCTIYVTYSNPKLMRCCKYCKE